MKAVILAGGFGTRISEESAFRPKPMIEIGGRPILWHIMKIYSHYGVNDFVICCGHKGNIIKEYFANYALYQSDFTIDYRRDAVEVHASIAEPWRVTLVDTGETTLTGGRIKRIESFIDDDEFFFTYGDGLGNVDLPQLLAYHRKQRCHATVTAVQPAARFGSLELGDGFVREFKEKPPGDAGWVSGGFFILSRAIFDYIDGDTTIWEREPMERLARESQLAAFQHRGFWQPLDTLRDKQILDDYWASGSAPWRIWDDRIGQSATPLERRRTAKATTRTRFKKESKR